MAGGSCLATAGESAASHTFSYTQAYRPAQTEELGQEDRRQDLSWDPRDQEHQEKISHTRIHEPESHLHDNRSHWGCSSLLMTSNDTLTQTST